MPGPLETYRHRCAMMKTQRSSAELLKERKAPISVNTAGNRLSSAPSVAPAQGRSNARPIRDIQTQMRHDENATIFSRAVEGTKGTNFSEHSGQPAELSSERRSSTGP